MNAFGEASALSLPWRCPLEHKDCGGWIRADIIDHEGKKVVGLKCNKCDMATPIPKDKSALCAALDLLDGNVADKTYGLPRVAMGRAW